MNLERIIRLGLTFCILMLLCLGCSSLSEMFGKKKADKPEPTTSVGGKPSSPQEMQPELAPKETTYSVHTVQWRGESLSIIAAWYTGTIQNWETLASANPQLNPDRIFPGDKISIPEEMLKTRKPMPEEFVASFLPKAKEETLPEQSAPPPGDEEELMLYGPKGLPQK